MVFVGRYYIRLVQLGREDWHWWLMGLDLCMKKRTKEVVCGKGLWVMGYNGNRSGYYRGERERKRDR